MLSVYTNIEMQINVLLLLRHCPTSVKNTQQSLSTPNVGTPAIYLTLVKTVLK